MDQLYMEFISSIKLLEGKKCWNFIAGKGLGSSIGIDFGEKIIRPKPLKNPKLSIEQRTYSAEFSFLIWSTWRLDSDNAVICGADDSNEINGRKINGLKRIIDQTVKSIEISSPGLDIVLRFNNNLFFRIFCDCTDDESYENYSFYMPNKIYTVEAKSILISEDRV